MSPPEPTTSSLIQEIEQLKQMLHELRADHLAAKEKERRDAWTRYTSVTIVVIAVATAIAAQWATRYTTRTLALLNDATFHQVKASDEWNYFQAKSIKQNLYELTRDRERAAGAPQGSPLGAFVDGVAAKVGKYEKEKQEIKAHAEKLEAERDESRERSTLAARKNGEMNLAAALFQIAIALGSICLMMKRRWMWLASMAVAMVAAVITLRGWLL